jgi:hypothetical protein
MLCSWHSWPFASQSTFAMRTSLANGWSGSCSAVCCHTGSRSLHQWHLHTWLFRKRADTKRQRQSGAPWGIEVHYDHFVRAMLQDKNKCLRVSVHSVCLSTVEVPYLHVFVEVTPVQCVYLPSLWQSSSALVFHVFLHSQGAAFVTIVHNQ